MNPNFKQHRHPGLWSLPQHSAKPTAHAIDALALHENNPARNMLATLRQTLMQATCTNTQCNRWITLIGQPTDTTMTQVLAVIQDAGINAEKVRWVRSNDDANKAWAAEQACLLDNSAVVVAWLGACHQRDTLRLQLARKHTQAQVILFNTLSSTTPLH